jgi:3-hydroxybutyryl-CoA dehydrogenase
MGLGIAYVASVRARLPVFIHDKSKEQLDKSLKLMDTLLEKDVKKGKIQQGEAKEARERLTVVDSISGFRDVDMCIEVSLLYTLFSKATHNLYPC